MSTLPPAITGYLIDGEGREIVVTAGSHGWPDEPVLRIVGTDLTYLASVTGEAAVWSLTPSDVAAIKATTSPGLSHVTAQVTIGEGDAMRSVMVMVLAIVAPGTGDPGPRVGPLPVIQGPFGPLHVLIGPPGRSVAAVRIDGNDLIFAVDGGHELAPVEVPALVAASEAAAAAAESAELAELWAGQQLVHVTVSPDYPGTVLRIEYPEFLAPAPHVVRLPIGDPA